MKKTLSFILSLIMVLGVLTSVPVTVNAASVGDLTFESNWNGESYSVSDCSESATGELVIPETYNGKPVLEIDVAAFMNCRGLTSITIPGSVTSISENVFKTCTSLTSINVASENENYCSVDGVLFNKKKTSLLQYPAGKTDKTYKIPDSITLIGDNSFYNCISLTSITIPNSVTTIMNGVFAYCSGLTSVTIGNSVESMGYSVFYNCIGLEKVYWNAKNVSDFDGSADLFWIAGTKSSGIEFIFGDNVEKIPALLCYVSMPGYYPKVESVVIGENVTSIGSSAFYGSNIKNIFYLGGSTQWDKIEIGGYNYGISGAKIHYNATGHTSSSWITDQKATANNEGVKYKECTQCGEILKTATIPQLKCDKPILKKVYNANDYVKVTWGTVKGADLYRVYRKTGTGSYEYIGSTKNTYFNDKNAPAGKNCRYRIKAKNEAGYSEYSASIAIKHIDEPTLKSIENSAYGVLIKWDKVTGAEKYNVYRKISGGEYKYIGATSDTYYTDKTAESGTKYYYAIRGKRDTSVSSQSASLSKYYLADPTLNTPTSTTSGIKLSWSKVTGAEGYYIYRKVTDGDWKKIGTVKGGTKIKYIDETPRTGATYQYRIKAYYSKTTSTYSNTHKIKCEC